MKKLLSSTEDYVKERALIKAQVWRRYFSIYPYEGPGQRAEIRIRYYEDQEMMIRPSAMIIGIRRVCRAYEFCAGLFFGVSEVGRCCSGQVGSAIPAGCIIVLFLPRPGKKCNWLDRNLSPRVEETARTGDARGM